MSRYTYDPDTRADLEHMLKLALSTVAPRLHIADQAADFGGVDVVYEVNGVPVQTRCRFNQPHYAPTRDVTFRTTEPRMIEDGTYAPLAIFVWFWNGRAKAGQLIDPYRAHAQLGMRSYRPIQNGDGTAFHAVPLPELLRVNAWLRTGDERSWSTVCTGGLAYIERLLRDGPPARPVQGTLL